eukprot:TRINITY_DN11285_c1_g1_i1.p2 TRINITY_DN11285_c1_g1~~TRINITY_DN11285_c1_g1_i1.p2  ORF type:complete len:448 (+),score=105.30 TRINITY_DN11285_c1_g1_i1:78-1346(+)
MSAPRQRPALPKGAEMDARLRQLRESLRKERSGQRLGAAARCAPAAAPAPASGTAGAPPAASGGFSLLSGDLATGDLSGRDMAPTAGVAQYIARARSEREREFAEIDSYRYDEEREAAEHRRGDCGPPPAPAAAAQPPAAGAGGTPQGPPAGAAPPSPAQRPRPPAKASPARPPRGQQRKQATGGGGDAIWGVYDLTSEGRSALRGYRGARGGASGPRRASADSRPPPAGAALAPPPPRSTALGGTGEAAAAARAAELQAAILAPPPVGSGAAAVAAHEARQRAALTELQALQQGKQRRPAQHPGAEAAGGGSLLDGEVDEAENRREFASALSAWRSAGAPAAQQGQQRRGAAGARPQQPPRPTRAAAAGPDATQLPAGPFDTPKGRDFIQGLRRSTQWVYFEHLRERFAAREELAAASADL